MGSDSSHVARCSRHRPRADLIQAPGEVNRAVCVWSDSSHVARCSRHRPRADLIRAPGEVNRAVCVE